MLELAGRRAFVLGAGAIALSIVVSLWWRAPVACVVGPLLLLVAFLAPTYCTRAAGFHGAYCSRCRYDLRELNDRDSTACPECGAALPPLLRRVRSGEAGP